MDYVLFFTIIGTAAAVIGFIYSFLRNFKMDINSHIDRLESRMDKFDQRMDIFENRMMSLEERMFYMATGKKLEDAILEERMKNPKTNP